MMKQLITIGIPTYNRNTLLNEALVCLLDQVDEYVQLIIVDNCSPEPVEETSREILDKFRAVGCNVRVVRNPVNVGGNCNMLNVLAQLPSGWMWTLGDDDEPKPNAIELIRREIEAAGDDCVLIKLSQPEALYIPKELEVYSNVDDLKIKMREFGNDWHCNMMFLSTSVYRTEYLKKHFALSFHFAYTCIPQVIIAFLALKDGKNIRYSPSLILNMEKSGKSTTLADYTPLRLGFCAIGEVPGLRELSDSYTPIISGGPWSLALRHFIIGQCYDTGNSRYWSSCSIRVGTSTGGLKGLLFVATGYFQRVFNFFPVLGGLLRKIIEKTGRRPQWISERA